MMMKVKNLCRHFKALDFHRHASLRLMNTERPAETEAITEGLLRVFTQPDKLKTSSDPSRPLLLIAASLPAGVRRSSSWRRAHRAGFIQWRQRGARPAGGDKRLFYLHVQQKQKHVRLRFRFSLFTGPGGFSRVHRWSLHVLHFKPKVLLRTTTVWEPIYVLQTVLFRNTQKAVQKPPLAAAK